MDLLFLSTVCELVPIISLAIKLGILIWLYSDVFSYGSNFTFY